ncbi:MAG: hypothetical protein AB8B85_15870 [Paracoccaceae bacterium]
MAGIQRLLLLAGLLFWPGTGLGQTHYTPPAGCEALATLRLASCVVRQISACANGNISDQFSEGRLIGRAEYSHPSLFMRFIGTNGSVSGHKYGPGAPKLGDVLKRGQRFEYSREVYRNMGEPTPGDQGTEVMQVGRLGTIEIGQRSHKVRDIRFEVTNEAGYRYVERALILVDPELTLGVTSRELASDGGTKSNYSSLPEAISLPGDPDFLGFDPAPSCLPAS